MRVENDTYDYTVCSVRAEVIIVISQSATFNLQKWNVLKRFVTMARAHEKDVVTMNECDKDRRSAKDRLRKDERTDRRTVRRAASSISEPDYSENGFVSGLDTQP